eukprot:SAG31_NODE_4993_length_2814_cov_3.680663_5_plen_81_part_00
MRSVIHKCVDDLLHGHANAKTLICRHHNSCVLCPVHVYTAVNALYLASLQIGRSEKYWSLMPAAAASGSSLYGISFEGES